MLKEHAKLMLLIQKAGNIQGRKKLQKMVYISKQFHFGFQEKFNFHFYGPYSEELTMQIEELSNLGFIEETKENKGNYSQYTYQLSPQGKEYLEVYPTDIERYDAFVTTLNEQSSRFLELVSTILFFQTLPKQELIEKIHKVKSKQQYTLEEIDKALDYIEQLRTFAVTV